MLRYGDRVSFVVRDVFLPEIDEVLKTLTEEVEVVGTLIDISESALHSATFAVIEVGENRSVIVPMDKVASLAVGSKSADRGDMQT